MLGLTFEGITALAMCSSIKNYKLGFVLSMVMLWDRGADVIERIVVDFTLLCIFR